MTYNIRDYTDWAVLVAPQLKGLDRWQLLQIGLTCFERVMNVWREFAPDENRIFAALEALKNVQLQDRKSEEVLNWKETVMNCNETAANAEMRWNGEGSDVEGLTAFRASMAAASLSHLYWIVIRDEDLELAAGFCLGLAWAATNYDLAERLFQQSLIAEFQERRSLG